MDLDVKHFRLIQAREYTLAVFRPSEAQLNHHTAPIMVFKDVKIPEAESILAHAKPDLFPLAIRKETKTGLFLYKKNSAVQIAPQDTMKPFTLLHEQDQQMSGTDQLDATDAIKANLKVVNEAVRAMLSGQSSQVAHGR